MNRRVLSSVGIAAVTAVAVAVPSAAATPSGGGTAPVGGVARFGVQSWSSGQTAGSTAAVSSVPTWSGSFALSGATYRYKMVGKDPVAGSSSTTVPTEIVPITLTFDSGAPLTATSQVNSLRASPIFRSAAFTSGTTQYADAMQRAEFWKTVSRSSPAYHVLLGAPTVRSAVTIHVPAADGFESYYSPLKVYYAYVSYPYFVAQLRAVINAQHFPATSLPLLLSSNVFLYTGSTSNCCIYGYHGSYKPTASALNTYAYANYLTNGLSSTPGAEDIYNVSHEVAEWMNDPYVNNVVPRWVLPGTGTCFSNLLEVGDPVEALNPPGFSIAAGGKTWHPTDSAGISWFAHTAPSTEQNGKYSYAGHLTSPSTLC